ncbi:MAG: M15 family metallopeptidase [Acidimicrobiia bacterium]
MRRLLPFLALILTLVPAPGARAGESAVHPENRPTPIDGETNGQVRAEELVGIEGDCRTAREAGPSLALMLAAARADGVALLPDDCYRLRSAQASAHSRNCAAGNCACAAPAGGSMHGWGKAVDFDDRGGTLRFNSSGYHWMKAHAARYGWNHPRWAEPGGSACPEAWHWEWVGDGGNMDLDPIRADVVGVLARTAPGAGVAAKEQGYWVLGGLGQVVARGAAGDHGSAHGMPLRNLVKGGACTPSGKGYWLASSDGGVFSFGDAGFFGSLGSVKLNRPVVTMAATGTGRGHWLVASDGGVFTFGDAAFHGSLGAVRLNRPIVAMAATPTGAGYWLVADDGGLFTFGDAGFFGSLGATPPGEPVVGMAGTPTGAGYWLVTADGRVFPFGDAAAHGSLLSPPALPVVGIAATPTGAGYWLAGADGGIFTFGDARFAGTG